ncbi:MAG TPA: hypothetical protein VF494_01005 [Candidatus Limnocylindrales bacterium]
MTRGRAKKPELIVDRLVRLGILSEVGEASGRLGRPAAADLLAASLFGSPEGFASRQRAVLDLLREVGIVEAIEVDPLSGATRVRLSEPYRRLIEAGREPDREPGFDAAWDEGGPPAVKAWLEDEARKLGPSDPQEPEPQAESQRATSPEEIGPVDYRGLRDLIHEVYGGEGQRFLDTPRKALGGRTPRQALRDGDIDAVWEVAIAGVVGDWT